VVVWEDISALIHAVTFGGLRPFHSALIDQRSGFDRFDHAHIARHDGAALILKRPYGHHNHPCLCQNVSCQIPRGGPRRYTPTRRTPYVFSA
jgi:hypothetical protein